MPTNWEKVITLLEIYLSYHFRNDNDEYVYLRKLPVGVTKIPHNPWRAPFGLRPPKEDFVEIYRTIDSDRQEWELTFEIGDNRYLIILTLLKKKVEEWYMRWGNGYSMETRTLKIRELCPDPLTELRFLMGDSFFDTVIGGYAGGDMTKRESYNYVKMIMRAESEVNNEDLSEPL